MNIKAQGLLNAAKWIEETHGQAALRDVLRACSPELRDRYTSAIAINWHPLTELVEFLSVADAQLGRGDGKIAEEIGASAARSNMKGVFVRLLFYVAQPEFLMRRIAQIWRQFNDEGEMLLVAFDERAATIEVTGVPQPQRLFCATLTGWAREVARAMGASNPVVRHTECRARGGKRCVWQLRWSENVNEIASHHIEQGKPKG